MAIAAAPIAVEHLTRSYGKRRGIVDVSFELRPGEIFAFLGPNGAGKTTTIRVLMGLLRPTSGAARIFGLDTWARSAGAKAHVGFLPGEIDLYEGMTGRELLDFFASFRRDGSRARRDELALRLDLELGPKIRQLSKGNRQKLGILQALMHDAPLLVLDEPSSGLDPLKQQTFLELLREERERGKTVFLSSHALGEVERIADRVAIIREGRIVAIEGIEALKRMRGRRADLVLRAPMDAARLAELPGVRVLEVGADGTRMSFTIHGELAPVLRLLGGLPVEDLTITAADLETIFLEYYGPAPDGAQ